MLIKKLSLLVVFMALVVGCGVNHTSIKPGLYIHPDLITSENTYDEIHTNLSDIFLNTVECVEDHLTKNTGSPVFLDGRMENLAIFIKLPNIKFKCADQGLKDGCFYTFNRIEINTIALFGHEVLHYLLFLNFGDLDPKHVHMLWGRCV